MTSDLKGQLFRRFRAGVREYFAKRSVQPRMAARISASCRSVFEHAWARGNGQGLVMKKTGKPIDGVARYGEVIARHAHERLAHSGWLDSLSKDEKLARVANLKAKQLWAEARLAMITEEEPEKARNLRNSIRAWKRMITQKSRRWGLRRAEIDGKAKELLASGSRPENSRADERMQPATVAEAQEFPQTMGPM